jgi:hypothetical protein
MMKIGMNAVRCGVLGLAMAVAAGSAAAQVVTSFGGTTLGGPTWNRPLADRSGPSVAGTGVRYSAQAFYTLTGGSYDFLSQSASDPFLWDNLTFLYENSFDPSLPLTNLLEGNDDLGPLGTSGFSSTLAAGRQYVFVTTGFSPEQFIDDGNGGFFILAEEGDFSNTISGPGKVVLGVVPEPSTYLLMATGLIGLGVVVRQRRSV